MFLVLVPVLAFVCVLLYLGNRWSFESTRLLLLRSSVTFGAYLVLLMEALSPFKAVTRLGLGLGWLLPVAGLSMWAWRRQRLGSPLRLPVIELPKRWGDWCLLAGVVFVLAITAGVAWLSPPQTWDSLTYHMSRVAHWAQNASVWHYATGINRQTSMSPGAETITLNFYVLSASDRLATFTQWFAMIGSLVAVSVGAQLLGARSAGQWLATFFALTLPIGIVESSSTINDYVVAFWVLCAVVEVLRYLRSDEPRALFFVALAVALSMLTKPIAAPYLAPFLVWLAIVVLRRMGAINGLKWAGVGFLAVALINGGYLARNLITYGAVSNPADFAAHSNQLRTPQGVASVLIKNAGLQVGLPEFFKVNPTLSKVVIKAHLLLGLEIDDPRTTGDGEFRIAPPATQEDRTSNPYHFYLIMATFPATLLVWRRVGWQAVLFTVLSGVTLVLFSYLFTWHIFSVRYHLPFFLLLAPAVGVVWGAFEQLPVGYLFAALLLLASRPWLVSIDSRPLIPVERHSTVDSILIEPRAKLYFANALGLHDSFRDLASYIEGKQCSAVGVMLSGDDPEYLLWELMRAPRPDLQIEWIVRSRTDRYSVPNFTPCAVVCNGCKEASIRGLDEVTEYGRLRLYTQR